MLGKNHLHSQLAGLDRQENAWRIILEIARLHQERFCAELHLCRKERATISIIRSDAIGESESGGIVAVAGRLTAHFFYVSAVFSISSVLAEQQFRKAIVASFIKFSPSNHTAESCQIVPGFPNNILYNTITFYLQIQQKFNQSILLNS